MLEMVSAGVSNKPQGRYNPHAASEEEGGWMHTILVDIQKTQKEILAKVTTMHEQAQADRQRMSNLEMRVESLQKARMAGLTAQA